MSNDSRMSELEADYEAALDVLNERQRRFSENMLVAKTNQQAGRDAGYAESCISVTVAQLLNNPRVRRAVDLGRLLRTKRTNIDADHVLERLAQLDAVTVLDFFDVSDNTLKVKLEGMTEVQAYAVKKLEIEDLLGGGQKVKLELHDKLKTLELIGRHTDVKAWLDKAEDNVAADIVQRIRDARWAEVERKRLLTEGAVDAEVIE